MKTKKASPVGFNSPRANWRRRLVIILGAALLAIAWRQLPSLIAQAGSTASKAQLTGAMSGGKFQLKLQGQSSQVYEIQASTDLKSWTAIATNQASATGSLSFADSRANRFSSRFYRAVARTDISALGAGGFRSDRILVKPNAGVNLGRLNLSLGVSALKVFPAMGNLQVIKVPSGTTAST